MSSGHSDSDENRDSDSDATISSDFCKSKTPEDHKVCMFLYYYDIMFTVMLLQSPMSPEEGLVLINNVQNWSEVLNTVDKVIK